MSNTVKLSICPKCNAPIPAEAPQGLCPKCVLRGVATDTNAGLPATATSEIPSIERIAAAFPQLEIIELIGRGGMGFVFKARQPHLDRFVALKLLPDKLARDPRFTERFNREGRVLARLNHPSIVSVFDFGQTEHFYFLLMEYVDGVNLRQAMRAGRFSPGEALSIVPKVCEALQYAHEQGILHRDIKPENILLDAKGRVKIADFGIAKLVGEDKPDIALTATGVAIGTMHYMAPEQLEKPGEVDHRADIYSLGVVFYEMLTGELPIGRFAAPSSKTPVGANVDEVVFRTLEKEPGRRYQTAGEVQTRVQDLADEAGAEDHRWSSTLPASAQRGPHGTVVMGDPTLVERPAQALLAAGIFNWVGSIVVVCLLAFTGLGRAWPLSPTELGRVCLLILAFSSVIIAGALKMRRLEAYPLAVLGGVLAMITSPGSIVGLPIGLWALLTLRQPKVRAAFALSKTNDPGPQRRGVLKWVFICVLVVGMGVVMVTGPKRNAPGTPAATQQSSAIPEATDAAPWIRFTFTAVELRELQGVRWLAIDYLDDVHGEVQKAFPWETTIPGFKAEARASEFISDAKDSSPPVRHQRIEYRMPDSAPRHQLERLRENLEQALKQKSFRLELGENEVPLLLFELPGAEGGSLKARIKVVPPLNARSPVSDSKLVIDVWPGAYPAGVTPQPDKLSWKFKCLIPPDHLAQILFVRWTNGVPAIQQYQSAYYKVGAVPAEIDLHLSYDKHGSSQPANERSQWNVDLGRGNTMSTFLREEPTYVPLNTPGRMTVRSGRQRSVPMVDFADTSRQPSRGQNGIDLRVLLMPLKSPAIRTVPTERDHGNFTSGMGLTGTMEEALKFLKELPTDP